MINNNLPVGNTDLNINQIKKQIAANRFMLPVSKAHNEMAPHRKNNISVLDQKNIKYAAVLMLLFPYRNTVSTIFIHRARYEGIHSNQIAFPGGKYEKQDGSYFQTALRETEEELGIPSDNIHKIIQLSNIYIPVSNFQITPFLGVTHGLPEIIPDKREINDYFTAPIEAFFQKNAVKNKEVKAGPEQSIVVPCFVFNHNIIWGATAMILNEARYLIGSSKTGTDNR